MSFLSDNYRICIIEGCGHFVPPQNEVDIGVGNYQSSETPICEDCYMSEDPEINRQIKESESRDKSGLPF